MSDQGCKFQSRGSLATALLFLVCVNQCSLDSKMDRVLKQTQELQQKVEAQR